MSPAESETQGSPNKSEASLARERPNGADIPRPHSPGPPSPSPSTSPEANALNAARTLLLARIQKIRAVALLARDQHIAARNRLSAKRAADLAELRSGASKRAKEQLSAMSIAMGVGPVANGHAKDKLVEEAIQKVRAGELSNGDDGQFETEPAKTSATQLLNENTEINDRYREQQKIIRMSNEIQRRNLALAKERLPKQPEAPRNKCHWDYLLEEAMAVGTEIREERKWKIALAKKVSKLIEKHFADKDARQRRAEKDESLRLRRKANGMARDVKKFWSQIGQIAEHRQSILQEVEDKAQREKQLDFLIDETQKFTKAIAKNLGESKPLGESKQVTKTNLGRKRAREETMAEEESDAEDFDNRSQDSADDEETIEVEEQKDQSSAKPDEEIRNLAASADLSVEDLLRQQGIDPAVYFGAQSAVVADDSADEEMERRNGTTKQLIDRDLLTADSAEDNDQDKEFVGYPGDAKDDEATMEEEEKRMENIKDEQEGVRLRNDSERPIEEVISEYLKSGEPESEPESESGRGEEPSEEPKSMEDCELRKEGEAPARLEKPFLLKGNLRDYQHFGLEWLVSLYKKKLNGILADEMGLGKTIMTISLLSWLAINEANWGPHVIIVPTSVLLNWEVEFKKWAPGLKVLTYYGSLKERRAKRIGWSKQNSFHVCLTSYAIAVQDSTMFRRRKWKYMILDEAHNIKNFQSQRWQTFLNFDTKRRLLLTGTPLQNSVMELWSLMHFLMPEVFRSHSEFRDWFSNPINAIVLEEKQGSERENIVSRLHTVLRPFLLRRLKKEVEKGLPEKIEYVRSCRLSKRQRQLYEDYMARSDTETALASGNYIGVMNVLMQLRKVCNHPDLFDGRSIVSPFQSEAIELAVPSLVLQCRSDVLYHLPLNVFVGTSSTKFDPVDKTLMAENEIHDYILKLECPQVVDNADDRLLDYRRKVLETLLEISRQRCETLSSISSRTIDFLSFVKDPLEENAIAQEKGLWECGLEKMANFRKSWPDVAESARRMIEVFGTCVTKVQTSPAAIISPAFLGRCVNDESTMRELRRHQSLFGAAVTRSQVDFPDNRLIQWDCGKLQELVLLLREIQKRGDRTLIFTQMTKVLDVLEAFLNLHDYRYLRLDGATKTEDRQRLMERFNTDSKIFCMILTTRAGGVGLNLTGANCVIFYDNDWNPAIDAQAQDRVHRIGQTKQVYIYRLVCEKTVEENILRKANEKRNLESLVISQAEFTTDKIKKFNALELVAPDRVKPDEIFAPPHKLKSDTAQPNVDDQMDKAEGFDLLLLAAEDRDRAQEAKKVEADEAEMENEDFKEDALPPVDSDTVENVEKAALFRRRDILEESLSGIQQYCLRFVERTRVPADDEAPREEFVFEEAFTAERLLARRDSDSEESDEEVLFYTTEATGASHLKALTDTDEMKIFLPLRDGGPDDMVMSSVLGGTAAAGLQSAEDAAFYNYASMRMSRTSKATTRQREAIRRREIERKRRNEEAQKVAERQGESSQQGPPQRKMVNLLGVPSADSRTSSGTVKKFKFTQPVFPLKLKNDNKIPPREKVQWTEEEDRELQKLCLLTGLGANPGHPNFVYASRWLCASPLVAAGRRSMKSASDCKERFYALRGDPAGTGAPDKDTIARYSAGNDSARQDKILKSLALSGKKVRHSQKGIESFTKVVPVHASQVRMLAETEAAFGKAAPTPSDILKKFVTPPNHRPGYKTGESYRNLGRPEMRPITRRNGPAATGNTLSAVATQRIPPGAASGSGPNRPAQAAQRATQAGRQVATSNRAGTSSTAAASKPRPQQGTNGPGAVTSQASQAGRGAGRGAFKRAIGLPPGTRQPPSVVVPSRPAGQAPPRPTGGPSGGAQAQPSLPARANRPSVPNPQRTVVSVGRPGSNQFPPTKSTIKKGSGMLPGPGPGIPVAGTSTAGRGRPPNMPQARAQPSVSPPAERK